MGSDTSGPIGNQTLEGDRLVAQARDCLARGPSCFFLLVRATSAGSGSVRAWLVAIWLNVARSEVRRALRRPGKVAELDPARTPGTTVYESVIASVERAVAQLPEEQRTCLRRAHRPAWADRPGGRRRAQLPRGHGAVPGLPGTAAPGGAPARWDRP